MYSKPEIQTHPTLLDMGKIHAGICFIHYGGFFSLCFKFITGHIAEDELLVCDQVT